MISLHELGFFNSGEARLLPGAADKVKKIAAVLMQYGLDMRVEGHSDNVPIHNATFNSNWDLSTCARHGGGHDVDRRCRIRSPAHVDCRLWGVSSRGEQRYPGRPPGQSACRYCGCICFQTAPGQNTINGAATKCSDAISKHDEICNPERGRFTKAARAVCCRPKAKPRSNSRRCCGRGHRCVVFLCLPRHAHDICTTPALCQSLSLTPAVRPRSWS